MKVKITKDSKGKDGDIPAGTEIEHADAYMLCELGIAEPVDDEAKAMFKAYKGWKDKQDQELAERQKIVDEDRAAQRLASFEKRLRQGKL